MLKPIFKLLRKIEVKEIRLFMPALQNRKCVMTSTLHCPLATSRINLQGQEKGRPTDCSLDDPWSTPTPGLLKALKSLSTTLHNRLLKPQKTLSSEIHATCPFFKTNTQKPFLSVFYTPRCQALGLSHTRAHTGAHSDLHRGANLQRQISFYHEWAQCPCSFQLFLKTKKPHQKLTDLKLKKR